MRLIMIVMVVAMACGCAGGKSSSVSLSGGTSLEQEKPTRFILSTGETVVCSKLWTDYGGVYLSGCENNKCYLALTNLVEDGTN